MQAFLTTLLECSIAMSVISLVYMAAMPLLSKRYTAKWQYYVWLVVVVGWIFPFRPHLDTILLPVQIPAIQVMPIEHMGAVEVPTLIANETGRISTMPLWWVIAGVWLIGAVGMIAYHSWRHWRFIKMVSRWSEDVTDSQILGILDALKAKMRIETHVGLKICSGITSPMMIGFLRPAILLPSTNIATDELALILRHELVHLKGNDLWYKALVLLAIAIHWFNPVVYIMAKAIAVQCEISCDEMVLQGTSFQQRQQYGETIIGVIRNGAKLQTSLSTNYYGGKKGMKTRIFSIMDTTKKKAGVVVLCIALIAILGAGTVFAVTATSPKEVTADSTGTDAASSPAEKLNIKETYNMGNYSEFLKVENDSVKYYYNGHWVFSLYDENNEDAKLINENAKSIIYENAMEDKDVKDKGTPVYLKTVRNKETNKIEKLVEMSADEAWKILNGADDNIIRMARTPWDKN